MGFFFFFCECVFLFVVRCFFDLILGFFGRGSKVFVCLFAFVLHCFLLKNRV